MGCAHRTTGQGCDGQADRLRLAFWATPCEVRQALRQMRGHFGPRLLAGQGLDIAETVLAECLNNICKHAYPPDRPGRIDLRLVRMGAWLALEIRDRGVGMPDGRLPEGKLPSADTAPPEGGFGWYLIRTLSEDLRYRRQAGTNLLQMTVSLEDFSAS